MRTAIEKALHFALRVHEREKDEEGTDFILHVLRVVAAVSESTQNDTETVIIAILHDTVETEPSAIDFINRTFSEDVLTSVKLLTRNKEENYFVYINRLKVNKMAREVKLADLYDNLLFWRKGKTKEQTEKYIKAISCLQEMK